MIMSIERKLRRRHQNSLKKTFKKTFEEVKKLVKCSVCERTPAHGDIIDDWVMEMREGKITLICPDHGEKT